MLPLNIEDEEHCSIILCTNITSDPKTQLEQLNEKYNLDIPDGEYETLGGFILANLEEIPPTGEIFIIDQFEIKTKLEALYKILNLKKNASEKVLASLLPSRSDLGV